MKKLKYMKLFENFGAELDPKLIKALKDICTCYKSECMGNTEHLSEYFDNGDILLTLSQTTDDSRIKNILSSVAEYCELECEGSAEIILEWITDDDCDYIAKFLGLEPLDYEGDWTKEEEDSWESR